MKRTLPRDLTCFICGRDNPFGLKLCFEAIDELNVSARFKAADHLIGFKEMMHGGIISAVLDDAMDWALYNSTQKLYVTSELTVNFKKPAPVNQDLKVLATSQREPGSRVRKIEYAKAVLMDSDGEIIAEAKGKFFQITEERTKELLSYWVKP